MYLSGYRIWILRRCTKSTSPSVLDKQVVGSSKTAVLTTGCIRLVQVFFGSMARVSITSCQGLCRDMATDNFKPTCTAGTGKTTLWYVLHI